jgi:hypothetical protein
MLVFLWKATMILSMQVHVQGLSPIREGFFYADSDALSTLFSTNSLQTTEPPLRQKP